MTIEQLRELIERLRADATQVTTDELTAARQFIREQRDHLANQTTTGDVLAAFRELLETKTAIDEVTTTREAEAAALEEQRQGLLNDLQDQDQTPTADTGDAGNGDAALTEPAPTQTAADAVTSDTAPPVADLTPTGSEVEVASPTAIAAAGNRAPIGTFRYGPMKVAPNTDLVVSGHVTAAGGASGFTPGQELRNTAELAQAFAAHLKSMSAGRGGGTGEKVYVANVVHRTPEARTLRLKDWVGNFSKIENAAGEQALTAAGGLCAPLEVLYDVQVIGSVARPIRDALPRFQVDRGGIQFRPHSSAAAALTTGTGTGVGVWTNDQDASASGDTKGCYIVSCPAIQEAEVQAIWLCLEFSNVTARFDPETTAANIREGMIAHARRAENELLRQLQATSKVLSAPKVIGATRDVLVNVDKAVAYYRNRHRLDTPLALTSIMPAWVLYMMRADLARQMAAGDWADALSVTDAMITQWFRNRGVNPVWHLDGGIGGVNEVQTVTVTGTPTGGTYTLTFSGQTTAPIAFNTTAADVRTALEALSNINFGEITVAGGPHPGTAITVGFGGQYEHTDVPQMTASGAGLTGGSSPAVAVTTTTTSSLTSVVNGVSIASQVYANAAAGAPIPGFPDQVDCLLYANGTKLFLDGGTLDLGLVRDSTLNARNRYRQFSEGFEGVADRGIENLRLVMTVQPTGQTGGTKDLDAIVD